MTNEIPIESEPRRGRQSEYPLTVKQMEERIATISDTSALREIAKTDDRAGVQKATAARLGDLMLHAMEPGSVSAEEEQLATQGIVSDEEMGIFEIPANAEALKEGANGAVTSGTITHRGIQPRILFLKTKDGWMRREVPASNVPMLLATMGPDKSPMWKINCGHCGLASCRGPNSEFGEGPFDCPNMPKRQFARCPVCRKKFYDPLDPEHPLSAEEREEGEIAIDTLSEKSPKERILARLAPHMSGYHEQESFIYDLRSPAVVR